MSDKSSFSFLIPDQPEGREVSAEEAERLILERLREIEGEFEKTIWQLVNVYCRTGRQPEAFPYVERLISSTNDPDRKAAGYLRMGQLMEQIRDYESAITFYTEAFSLEPTNNDVWYLINNNLGFCLNHFGRHQEAEPYCRAAIRIDPKRHNAYKNLGISLEGQGEFVNAAKYYITAVRANAADPRALKHLEDLMAEHSEISLEIKDIFEQLEDCRKAVRKIRELLNGLDSR